jgi:hypothetical protein
MTVRFIGVAGAAVTLALAFPGARGMRAAPRTPAAPEVTVYKTPTCGCCVNWIRHLERAGFTVTAHDTANVAPIRNRHGVPQALQSCHTALVGGYVVEGHVPADVIQRLLRERPRVAGIAVPGMPAGSPGMEGLGGPARQPYQVLAFRAEGGWTVYERR